MFVRCDHAGLRCYDDRNPLNLVTPSFAPSDPVRNFVSSPLRAIGHIVCKKGSRIQGFKGSSEKRPGGLIPGLFFCWFVCE